MSTNPESLKDRLLAKAREYDNDPELHQLATDVHMMEFTYKKMKDKVDALQAELAPYMEDFDDQPIPDYDADPTGNKNAQAEGAELPEEDAQ